MFLLLSLQFSEYNFAKKKGCEKIELDVHDYKYIDLEIKNKICIQLCFRGLSITVKSALF